MLQKLLGRVEEGRAGRAAGGVAVAVPLPQRGWPPGYCELQGPPRPQKLSGADQVHRPGSQGPVQLPGPGLGGSAAAVYAHRFRCRLRAGAGSKVPQ